MAVDDETSKERKFIGGFNLSDMSNFTFPLIALNADEERLCFTLRWARALVWTLGLVSFQYHEDNCETHDDRNWERDLPVAEPIRLLGILDFSTREDPLGTTTAKIPNSWTPLTQRRHPGVGQPVDKTTFAQRPQMPLVA